MNKFDIIIVGAGISGCVLAQHYASIKKKVLVIEKRDHIAGNSYDYIDKNGSLVFKYNSPLFHTTENDVWEYVNQFSEWRQDPVTKEKTDTLECTALPICGYTQMLQKMLDNPYIDVMLNTDYFDIGHDITCFEKLFFTGAMDQYSENLIDSYFAENPNDYSRTVNYPYPEMIANVYFTGGTLANYKYLPIEVALKNAIVLFNNLERMNIAKQNA